MPTGRRRRRAERRLAVLAATLLVALGAAISAAGASGRAAQPAPRFAHGQASPWPSMRHDTDNTGRGDVAATYHGDRPWSFATGRGLFITPVIAGDGTVYFGSADHRFYALAPDGRPRWSFTTGNIIDAAAALDRTQRTVTIGSGDENLYQLRTDPRPLSRRQRIVWRYRATLAPAAGQLVDWWEGDVGYGPDGDLFTGNTGGVAYSFTPSGRLRWTFRAGNSVWTMPAFGRDGVTYWGSVDRSIYALGPGGQQLWSHPTLGFVTASPAIGSDGTVYVGSFDSRLYALDPATGVARWTFPTHDSIYSSPALGESSGGATNAIYVASTDGTVDKLSTTGRLLWSYDTGEAIRSSPVLGPGPSGRGEIVYVGSSDGSLYALDARTGRRRWSFDTISTDAVLRDRHQLNSSPALGRRGVYIGSEDGRLWYVPYDYCRHRSDRRCNTDPGEPYADNLSRVLPVSAGGTTERDDGGTVPSSTEIVARLIVRHRGTTIDAAMIPGRTAAALVHTSPRFRFRAQLSGDGRYIFITPSRFLAPNAIYRITVAGRWGADGQREADWTLPGTWKRHGRFAGSFTVHTAAARTALPLGAARNRVSAFELRRLALPLPAFLPSVNQIGFDSYVLLVGAIRVGRPGAGGIGPILLWATQARQGAGGAAVVDPRGTLVFPLAGTYRGNTLRLGVDRATLTFSFGTVPLQRLDMGFALGPSLQAAPGASVSAQARCDDVPNYGHATFLTGVCNAAGILAASGTFITDAYPTAGRADRRPSGLSVASVRLSAPTAARPGLVTAELALRPGARFASASHRIGLLLVDDDGRPLGLDYTAQRTLTDRRGNISRVELTLPAATRLPRHVRVDVLADVFPLFTRQLR